MYSSDQKEKLLFRLEEIGKSLKNTGLAKALIGFGSVAETDRMDAYSDLDFIAVAKKGKKLALIENIDWLTSCAPVDYYYLFTEDGYKLFYRDNIFCDFGILEEEELQQIPHAKGRIIWCESEFDHRYALPTNENNSEVTDIDWVLGEALTSIYVGLCRYARGEKLSALKNIQNIALEHILSCSHLIDKEKSKLKDPFQNERRFEKRFPSLTEFLPKMMQGYEKSPESALAILVFMDSHFQINTFMRDKIINFSKELIQNKH